MMETIATTNGIKIRINTMFKYVEFAPAYDYYDDIDEGIVLLWRNPYYKDGITQVDDIIYPLTVAGIWQAYNDARQMSNGIEQLVADNTFTFRR